MSLLPNRKRNPAQYLLFPLLLLLSISCADTPGPSGAPENPGPYPIEPSPTSPMVSYPAPDEPAPETPLDAAQTPAATATLAPPIAVPPQVVEYNLGETTLNQSQFPADSPMHSMPARLEGVIGVPAGAGPFPVALILHGNHHGCPFDETRGLDTWPCAVEDEQRNYRGFIYLVRELAAHGIMSLSININAQYTLGFGEETGMDRFTQLVDQHLTALATANAGGVNDFGLPIEGQADLSRLIWIGHSQGGELGLRLVQERQFTDALVAGFAGYGPVRGMLMVAPSLNFVGSDVIPSDLPLAVILPECDGDVVRLDGQHYFEAARDDRDRTAPTTAVLLYHATHNAFNTVVGLDSLPPDFRPECTTDVLVDANVQREFMVAYSVDFIDLALGTDGAATEAVTRLGINPALRTPQEVAGLPAAPLISPPAGDELLLLRPFSTAEETRSLAGGTVTASNLDLFTCPAGYFGPFTHPELAPCRRINLTQPADPQQFLLSWDTADAALQLEMPPAEEDWRSYDALRLRAALDPLAAENEPGEPLSFSISLIDQNSATASTVVALDFPRGEQLPQDDIPGGLFSGIVFMEDIRLPLAVFDGIDLSRVSQIKFGFDRDDSGAFFLADIGLLTAPHYPGSYATLLSNRDGSLDALRGIGRLRGASDCTAVLIDSGGGPKATAYAVTSGHCVQDWDANNVNRDQPGGDYNVIFNYFVDTQNQQVIVPVSRIAYSTMKGRDIAVLALETTVAALADQRILPLRIASDPVDRETTIQVVGAPQTGLDPAAAFLRHERCNLNGRANLLEFTWHFYDTYRNDCQDISGGSSGSPVFAGAGDEIIALINTTTIGSTYPCYLGAPCELQETGTRLRPNTSYATPVDGLGNCFDGEGNFDLTVAGCPLDNGRQLQVVGVPAHAVQATLAGENGETSPATWNASLSGDLPYYRYKVGPASVTDCRDQIGYGPAVALDQQAGINAPLPPQDGSYLLCILAGPQVEIDDTWQPASFATVLRVEVDNTPPITTPPVQVRLLDNQLQVRPIFLPPDLSSYDLKVGPVGETDCSDEAGYFPYRRVPLRIPVDLLPQTLCVIAEDVAGNRTAPQVRELGVEANP